VTIIQCDYYEDLDHTVHHVVIDNQQNRACRRKAAEQLYSGATALSVQDIKDAFLILSRTGMLTPMLTPMLPTVVSSWLDVPWMVDHS
jgi:hypothetical protein